MVDLVAGHVKLATVTYATASGQVRAGKLKALAISSEARLAHFPEIPTFKELGHPDMISLSWFGISGPKGLPRDIIESINREILVVMQKPEVKARLDRDAVEVKLMSVAETNKYFESETARWAPARQSAAGEGIQDRMRQMNYGPCAHALSAASSSFDVTSGLIASRSGETNAPGRQHADLFFHDGSARARPRPCERDGWPRGRGEALLRGFAVSPFWCCQDRGDSRTAGPRRDPPREPSAQCTGYSNCGSAPSSDRRQLTGCG